MSRKSRLIVVVFKNMSRKSLTPKTADLQRLMADPNLRRHVANATSAALPPIPNGTCIGDIAADMADVMLSIAAGLAPRPKRPRGPQG